MRMSLKRYFSRNRAKSPFLPAISTIFKRFCNPPINVILNPSTRMQIVAHRAIALSNALQSHPAIGQCCNCPAHPDCAQWHRTIISPMLRICCDSFEMGLRPQCIAPILHTPIYTLSQCRGAHLTRFSQERRKQQKKSLSVAKNFFPFSAFFPFFRNQKN